MSASNPDGSTSCAWVDVLTGLELVVDSAGWRLLEDAHKLKQTFRRRWLRAPNTESVRRVGAVGEKSCSPQDLVRALRQALRVGAYETAAALSDRASDQLAELEAPLAVEAAALIVESLLVAGARERARAVAVDHRALLELTAAGATMLELVGMGSGHPWLPDGRLNMVAISRRLVDGSLGAHELARVLARRPWAWAGNPELHLLFFAALRDSHPARARAFLNRYLRCQRLPRCSVDESSRDLLGGIEFDRTCLPRSRPGPPVSVLVSAHNAAGTIPYAVDSLLQQTYPMLEILVCDDASDDETLDTLRRRYWHNPRVRIFRSSRNQGPYNVRNALARHARGELLTFHDADDVAMPTRIDAQVRQMRGTGAVACINHWLRVTPDGRFVFFKDQRAARLSLVSTMLTRRAWEVVGPFRPARVGADLELVADLAAHFGWRRIRRIATPLIFGLWGPSSLTRQRGTEALEDGYRSPVRRSYGEMVFAKHATGFCRASPEEIEARLAAHGCLVRASPIDEIS